MELQDANTRHSKLKRKEPDMTTTNSPAKIQSVTSLALVERDEEIRAITLGLIAREHVLLVGPPGTGKSYLCRQLCNAIDGARFVERLSPTTDPDEVWGPVDPVEYRNTGRYVRRSEGYAPAAHLLFLDEFFRASDAIRDTMLHLLGPERQTLVDGQQIHSPLLCAVGATNTWADTADQAAIFDRWLIRRVVRPVSHAGRDRLLFDVLPAVTPVTTLAEIIAAGDAAAKIPVSAEAKEALSAILDGLTAEGIRPSDRRCRASIKVARAAAALDGHTEVEPGDLEPLADVLWDQPEQRDKAGQVIVQIANPVGARLNSLLAEIDQIVSEVGDDTSKRLAAIKKLQASQAEVQKLSVSGNGRAAKVLTYIKGEALRLNAAALGISPEKAAALMGGK